MFRIRIAFNADPDPAFYVHADLDLDPDPVFSWYKIEKIYNQIQKMYNSIRIQIQCSDDLKFEQKIFQLLKNNTVWYRYSFDQKQSPRPPERPSKLHEKEAFALLKHKKTSSTSKHENSNFFPIFVG